MDNASNRDMRVSTVSYTRDWDRLRPLVYRFISYIGCLCVLLNVVYFIYNEDKISKEVNVIFQEVSRILAKPLVQFNYEQSTTIGELISSRTNVNGVKITDQLGSVFFERDLRKTSRSIMISEDVLHHSPTSGLALAGGLEIDFAVPSYFTYLSVGLTTTFLAVLLVYWPTTLFFQHYIRTSMISPITALENAISRTIDTDEHVTTNLRSDTIVGSLAEYFDKMQNHLRASRQQQHLMLESRKETLEQLRDANENLQLISDEQRQLSMMLQSTMELTDQSVAFYDRQKGMTTFLAPSTPEPIAEFLSNKAFSTQDAIDFFTPISNSVEKIGQTQGALNLQVTFDNDVSWQLRSIMNEGNIQVVIASSVSDLYVAEQERLRGKKLEALGRLTSGVAHDINNINAIILNFAETLLDADLEVGKVPETAQQIILCCERAGSVVEQLLVIAREKPALRTVQPVKDLLLSLNSLVPAILGPQIKFSVECYSSALINVNVGLFHSAIINLSTNAKNAMPDGGTLKIIAEDTEYKGTQGVKISVIDDGCGIPDSIIEKLFDPFFTTLGDKGGSGLGLAMVYSFATESDGQIDCVSEVDKGAEFVLKFPSASNKAVVPHFKNKSEALSKPQKMKTVLVCEDEQMLLRLITLAFEKTNYNIIGCSNLSSAMEELSQYEDSDFINILTDHQLPDGTGVSLIEEASSRFKSVKAIMISGNYIKTPDFDSNVDMRSIPKPFSMASLISLGDDFFY